MLKELVEGHGLSIVEDWCDERDRHKHRLIHLAVKSNFVELIKVMVSELGFDPNICRTSDKCTPLHLAIWFNYPEMAMLLISHGADQSLENSYEESCAEEYVKFVKFRECLHAPARAAERHVG